MPFLTPYRIWTFKVGRDELAVNERIIPVDARAPRQIAAHIPKGGRMKPDALLGGDGKACGITVHNTNDITVPAGTNPAEQYSRATWPNANMRGVVVHFYVWRRDIWQILDLTEQGWHASDGASRRAGNRAGQMIGGNLDTIAVEIIGNHAETEQTGAMLCAHLLREKGLDPSDLYTHNFFMGRPDRVVQGAAKNCPLYILPRWEQFRGEVRSFYDAIGDPSSPAAGRPFEIGDALLFAGGPVFISSDGAAGVKRPPAVCTLTRVAAGALRPYHLESVCPGVVFGWVDAENVSREQKIPPCDGGDELSLLQAKHDRLRGQLHALAELWPI